MEKKLAQYSTISTLDIHKIFLYLLIILKIINISETLFMQALVDSGVTRIFVNQNFVNKYWLFLF